MAAQSTHLLFHLSKFDGFAPLLLVQLLHFQLEAPSLFPNSLIFHLLLLYLILMLAK